uniref:uncharacterized protein LOC105349612 isoform X2 n=1 Tax=Fragaria vesca subsp. vesca TaxID=101020 RepID=UPI0005CA347C|nr:PREDICTED: uncharacterized protein LOC105349612 isoform X2 [Fragaria vesca subsp. vesca]
MEVSHKKKGERPNLLADTVFSCSLDDVFNERLFKNKVEKIPDSFHSVEHYFGCYLYPLLEETQAQVHSSMETIHSAPYAIVVSFENAKPYGRKLYNTKVDFWRNRFSDRGKEPYKTLPGDLFVLANAKPEIDSDLQRVGRSWVFGSVSEVSENENKDDTTSLYFKIRASKELEVLMSTAPLFVVFLVNLIPNGRLWKALHMSKNLKIIKEVLCTDSVYEDERSRKNMVEVAIVSQILRDLYKEWVDSKQNLRIGVVSPYAAQLVAIEEKLGQDYNNLDGFIVKVKTVDEFQGDGEEDVIIFSTVRSNCQQSLEFISNMQRINVALTRARHWLWILGNERTLCDSESVWETLVLDPKNFQCFFNADEDKELAKAILQVKKQFDQLDDLLNSDSLLFRKARWKVLFSDNLSKSFMKLKSVSLKRSVLNVLLKLANGWRPKMQSSDILCGNSSLILKKFKVEDLHIVCPTDTAKDLRYIRVLKSWGIIPIEDTPPLVNRLHNISNKLMPNRKESPKKDGYVMGKFVKKLKEFQCDNIESSCARSLPTLLYTDEYINLCKEKCLEGNVNSSTEVEAEYNIVSWHGTTVLWIQLPTKLLVGVDSFAASIHTDNNPSTNMKEYEGFMSEVEQKFVPIIKGIYATLCGGGNRCNEMVVYVRKKILDFMVEGEEPTITRVGEVASKYFHEVSPLGSKDLPSTVFISFWKPQEKKYQVIEVGDDYKVACDRNEVIFGTGSGSRVALVELKLLTTPIDVTAVKDQLIKATLDDPHTGGPLRVFSLKGGTCKCKYEGIMMNELNDPVYANILFDGKSMFVILHKENEYILTRQSLRKYLKESFGADANIHWLCIVKDTFLIYRVILPLPSYCNNWFNTCNVFKKPIRFQNYSNKRGSCCYFLCHARRPILERARNMTSYEDLADR